VIVGSLSRRAFDERLAGTGLKVQLGPFVVKIRAELPSIVSHLWAFYREYPLSALEAITDFDVGVRRCRSMRSGRRQAQFLVDGRPPFWPLPAGHALPGFEWGLNWCVATRAHNFLMLHSAVVERGGCAALFPAWPGHGKSTLCTGLIHSGWRLLSDEFGLVCPEDGSLVPLPRLIPLKNESIGVIRRFRPEAHIGPSFYGTRKGTVAHVRPPADSISRAQETALPRWLVFPRWVAGSPLILEPMDKGQAFLMVATNAFNYEVLGEIAFNLVSAMVRRCDCYSLTYSDLDEAIDAMDRLSASIHA